MEKEVRNRIQRATQAARRLLETEYAEQLEGTFDIRLDGTIAPEVGRNLSAEQGVVRRKLVAAVEHRRAGGVTSAEAVAAYLREAAFTTLNRFVALKMLEARELVQECVSRGEDSSGFNEFKGLAPGAVKLLDEAYRIYIESLFDEIGREVRVLFDRRDPASLLWPRRTALLELLAILNASDLENVWAEDETIGWVYQYFNSDEERRKMRAESLAPRNSRELAVRNQFFTPRTVVKFLTDNTLGRIWYEMQQGQTQLVSSCEYLVRWPNEKFLQKDQIQPTATAKLTENASTKDSKYIPFRPKKDPRDIKILDPACGSGHFLLYSFDIFLKIYTEAWQDADSPVSQVTATSLCEDYKTISDLYHDLPVLIMRHNIYGLDIDQRASQIAALALWLKAQRSFKDLRISRENRKAIRETNIVAAEPMPGDPDLRIEFIASLDFQLSQLVRRIFEKMELAGEAGYLLRIEVEIQTAIRDIYGSYGELFQQADEERWRKAEEDLHAALGKYIREAHAGMFFRRRMFAGDAAQGLAFIGICRQHYDVLLMNPPFGQPTPDTVKLLRENFPGSHNDIFAAFTSRGIELTGNCGRVGAISTRSFLVARRLEVFRRKTFLPNVEILIDLGGNIMDNAFVESCAWTINSCRSDPHFLAQDHRDTDLTNPIRFQDWIIVNFNRFDKLPQAQILYSLPNRLVNLLGQGPRFEPEFGTAREGMKPFDNVRFLRLRWEAPTEDIGWLKTWRVYAKGGPYRYLYGELELVINWNDQGRELCAINIQRNGSTAQVRQASAFWGQAGVTYSRRSAAGFSARALPAETIFSDSGPAVIPLKKEFLFLLLIWFNSRMIRALIQLQANASKFMTGILKNLPWSNPTNKDIETLSIVTKEAIIKILLRESTNERSPWFYGPLLGDSLRQGAAVTKTLNYDAETATNIALNFANKIVDSTYGGSSEKWAKDVLLEDDKEPIGKDESDCGQTVVEDHIPTYTHLLISWLFGISIGRYKAKRHDLACRKLDPEFVFRPIPLYQPAQGRENLLESEVLLVDDPGHPNDIDRSITLIAKNCLEGKADRILLEIQNVINQQISSWIRLEFWQYHLSLYSSSRRQAPIYWQLATPSAKYSVWLYYHRFTQDTFYKVLNDFITPKLHHEERKNNDLIQDAGPSPTATQRKEISAQESFVEELRTFREEIARIAPLWNPNLNDGVIINFAPLWRLVPHHKAWQKECKSCWDKLVKGDYDWSHLAMHLWPERVVPKCAEDRSLAIAHELEDNFWREDEKGKWHPCEVEPATVAELIAERTSTAVKEALDNLLSASAPLGGRRPSRPTR